MGVSGPVIRIGCCGFQVSKRKYYEELDLVEVQKTFYKLPKLETASKWRKEAPESFEFTLKVWMAITHDPRSRIWNKTGLPPEGNRGLFRPSKSNFEAWESFRAVAKELRAKVAIFQSPPSFDSSDENISNVREFLSSITNDMSLGWEIRNDSWYSNPAFIEILREFNITHVVDLLYEKPVYGEFRYYRLHGARKGKKIVYSYKYTESDLRKLGRLVNEYLAEKNYILFNNSYYSFGNAIEFKRMMHGGI